MCLFFLSTLERAPSLTAVFCYLHFDASVTRNLVILYNTPTCHAVSLHLSTFCSTPHLLECRTYNPLPKIAFALWFLCVLQIHFSLGWNVYYSDSFSAVLSMPFYHFYAQFAAKTITFTCWFMCSPFLRYFGKLCSGLYSDLQIGTAKATPTHGACRAILMMIKVPPKRCQEHSSTIACWI